MSENGMKVSDPYPRYINIEYGDIDENNFNRNLFSSSNKGVSLSIRGFNDVFTFELYYQYSTRGQTTLSMLNGSTSQVIVVENGSVNIDDVQLLTNATIDVSTAAYSCIYGGSKNKGSIPEEDMVALLLGDQLLLSASYNQTGYNIFPNLKVWLSDEPLVDI